MCPYVLINQDTWIFLNYNISTLIFFFTFEIYQLVQSGPDAIVPNFSLAIKSLEKSRFNRQGSAAAALLRSITHPKFWD